MNIADTPSPLLFKCPVCHGELTLQGVYYACESNHTFDMAKEGYVNLLLAQHKRSKNPGDSADMINSRQRFLNKGYYQCLSDAINESVSVEGKVANSTLLEIGCGEGYYLQRLAEWALQHSMAMSFAGIDISKPAVRLAAKRKMGAQFSVISAYQLPYFDRSVDIALSIFSPICTEETARVLKDDGKVIMVGPGKHHLNGLVAHIYDETVPHAGNSQVLDEASGFTLSEQSEITEKIIVKGEDILDLLTMTPYYWQISLEKKEQLLHLDVLETDIDFYIKTYVKNL